MTTEPDHESFDPDRHSDTYEALARRCEAGAKELEYEAAHAAEILPTRAGGDRMDPQQWAAQKLTAAQAARDYAVGLRAEAGEHDPLTPMEPGRLAQAEQVASAANLGGILIDGRGPAERQAQSDSVFDENHRRAWEAGEHPSQIKAAEIEATGRFTHVAETIDGHEQVPFWQLGGNTDEAAQRRADEGGHRFEPFEGHRGDEAEDEF
ncbi:hypothetical protein [Actinoplanes sp. NPDC026619]|uniref:hypothetical protein n=1 Tax=Actinoplanes sp. NPDC026619 TaxID=3155798 RepID=UPI0033C7E151